RVLGCDHSGCRFARAWRPVAGTARRTQRLDGALQRSDHDCALSAHWREADWGRHLRLLALTRPGPTRDVMASSWTRSWPVTDRSELPEGLSNPLRHQRYRRCHARYKLPYAGSRPTWRRSSTDSANETHLSPRRRASHCHGWVAM